VVPKLGANRRSPKSGSAGLLPLRRGLGLDPLDQVRHSLPDGVRGEMTPAREGLERHRLLRRELPWSDGLAALASPVLLGAVEPGPDESLGSAEDAEDDLVELGAGGEEEAGLDRAARHPDEGSFPEPPSLDWCAAAESAHRIGPTTHVRTEPGTAGPSSRQLLPPRPNGVAPRQQPWRRRHRRQSPLRYPPAGLTLDGFRISHFPAPPRGRGAPRHRGPRARDSSQRRLRYGSRSWRNSRFLPRNAEALSCNSRPGDETSRLLPENSRFVAVNSRLRSADCRSSRETSRLVAVNSRFLAATSRLVDRNSRLIFRDSRFVPAPEPRIQLDESRSALDSRPPARISRFLSRTSRPRGRRPFRIPGTAEGARHAATEKSPRQVRFQREERRRRTLGLRTAG